MAAPSCGELGATEPVPCGLASHSRRKTVESLNAAMIFRAMRVSESDGSLVETFNLTIGNFSWDDGVHKQSGFLSAEAADLRR